MFRAALGILRDTPTPAARVIDELVAAVSPALVATTRTRYFGFVIGGASDAATAADLMTSGWDQHTYRFSPRPPPPSSRRSRAVG